MFVSGVCGKSKIICVHLRNLRIKLVLDIGYSSFRLCPPAGPAGLYDPDAYALLPPFGFRLNLELAFKADAVHIFLIRVELTAPSDFTLVDRTEVNGFYENFRTDP